MLTIESVVDDMDVWATEEEGKFGEVEGENEGEEDDGR